MATGRARPNFAPHASHIPINAPVILSNGSALYDFRTGEMIYETFLPDRVREDLQQMARAIPTIGFEAYHHDAIYVYQPNAVTFRHLERAGMTAREVPIADIPLPWSKVILQQDYETLLHTQRYLLERWGEHYEVIFSNRVLLELTRKGSSKGGMVQYLARRLGIDAQHIYCVGDNQNDIPMLAVSAIPFAPANCAPEVKAVGRPYPGRLRGELRGADCGYPGSYLRVNMCAARRNSGGRRVLLLVPCCIAWTAARLKGLHRPGQQQGVIGQPVQGCPLIHRVGVQNVRPGGGHDQPRGLGPEHRRLQPHVDGGELQRPAGLLPPHPAQHRRQGLARSPGQPG